MQDKNRRRERACGQEAEPAQSAEKPVEAKQIRETLRERGITENDVRDAITWSRNDASNAVN